MVKNHSGYLSVVEHLFIRYFPLIRGRVAGAEGQTGQSRHPPHSQFFPAPRGTQRHSQARGDTLSHSVVCPVKRDQESLIREADRGLHVAPFNMKEQRPHPVLLLDF